MHILKYPTLSLLSNDEILMILFMSYDGRYPTFYEYLNKDIVEQTMLIEKIHKYELEQVNTVENYSIVIKGDKNKLDTLWFDTALYYFSLSLENNMCNEIVCFSKDNNSIIVDIYV